jgi:hypothetical protein
MRILALFEQYTGCGLIFAIAAGALCGAFAHASGRWSAGQPLPGVLGAAELAAVMAGLAWIRQRQRLRAEVAVVVAALHYVALGTREPGLAPLTALPDGAALRSAVCAMATKIAGRMDQLHDRAHQDPLTP